MYIQKIREKFYIKTEINLFINVQSTPNNIMPEVVQEFGLHYESLEKAQTEFIDKIPREIAII
jgi:hypothetical protein